MAPDRNGERRAMAATIAAGIVQVDSEMHKKPVEVAGIALEIADTIIELVDAGAGDDSDEGDTDK